MYEQPRAGCNTPLDVDRPDHTPAGVFVEVCHPLLAEKLDAVREADGKN